MSPLNPCVLCMVLDQTYGFIQDLRGAEEWEETDLNHWRQHNLEPPEQVKVGEVHLIYTATTVHAEAQIFPYKIALAIKYFYPEEELFILKVTDYAEFVSRPNTW